MEVNPECEGRNSVWLSVAAMNRKLFMVSRDKFGVIIVDIYCALMTAYGTDRPFAALHKSVRFWGSTCCAGELARMRVLDPDRTLISHCSQGVLNRLRIARFQAELISAPSSLTKPSKNSAPQ